MRIPLLFPLLLAAAWPNASQAAEVACHFEGGVIVAPATVAGIAGDYILDTGTPQTLLHETKAQTEGIAETVLSGAVELAGLKLEDRPLLVQDLDLRTWYLPTPVAGVIGMDVLGNFVMDVEFAPCRVRLWPAGTAPRYRGRVIPIDRDRGRPTAIASVSDGAHQITGAFVLATGANAPIRLADDLARATTANPVDLYPEGGWLTRLPLVTFAGRTGRDVGVGLMPPQGEVVGVLGGPVLAHFRLRFDFPAGKITVAPARP